jgi:hypothetical protein
MPWPRLTALAANIAFFVGRQDHRQGLGMDRLDDGIGRGGQKPINEVRAGDRLGLGAAGALELCPDPGEGSQRSLVVQGKPDDVLFLRLWIGLGSVFRKIVEWARHRFSGFIQARQFGDDVLRMFVTGGPPILDGGGIPRRIMVKSRSASVLRTTGAG